MTIYKIISIVLVSCFTSHCLGPVVGQKGQSVSEVQWSISEDQLLFDNVLISVIIPHEADESSDGVVSSLKIQGKEVPDEDNDPWSYSYLLKTTSSEWNEGKLSLQLSVSKPSEDSVYQRNAVINNVTFNEQKFLDRGTLGALTSTDTHAWTEGTVENVGDLSGDGLEDLLVIDGYTPYIRLGHAQTAENFKNIWEISNDRWYSIATCDLNGDGHLDVVAGNPEHHDYKGAIKVFFGPMTASKIFASTTELVGTSIREAGSYQYMGTTHTYDNTKNDGYGARVVCGRFSANQNPSVLSLPTTSGFNHLQNNSLSFIKNNFKTIMHIKYNIGILQGETLDISDLVFDMSSSSGKGIWKASWSRPIDLNQDGHEDVFFSNIADSIILINGQFNPPTIVSTQIYSKVFWGRSNGFAKSNKLAAFSFDYGTYTIDTVPFSLGDINRDGYPDVAVSHLSTNLTDANIDQLTDNNALIPKVRVYFGSQIFPGQTLDLFHPTNTSKRTRFGESVVAGDFNGDGFQDLAISAPGYDAVRHPEPEVFVFYGPGFSRHERLKTKFGTNNSWFGKRLTSLDINRDGRSDLMATLWGGYEAGSSWMGQLELIYDQD